MQRVMHVARSWMVLLLLLPSCAAGQVKDQPAVKAVAQAASPVASADVYQLPNGLTVILREDHTNPVAAFQMWVKVGGADEPAEKAGIAHVFEHMMFKGTKKREVGQIGREVSAAGGDINAYTSNDQTVYHLVMPSEYFDTGLDILADSMQNSTFDPVELKKELEVVVEEIRRGEDNPDRVLGEILDALAYQVHPYGRPVIGSKETVRSITRDEVLAFFAKWYVANNMTLVVVGDFQSAKVKQQIADLFQGMKQNPGLKHGRPVEPPQSEMRIGQTQRPFQREKLGIAFHIPSIHGEDGYVLDVLSDVLAGSSNAPLIDTLVNKLNIATGVFAYSYTPLDPGYFVAGATLESKDRNEVLRQLVRVLFEAAHGDVSESRLALAKTKIAAQFVYRMETAQGMAGELGYFKTIIDDMDFANRYLAVVNSVTPQRAAEVARKYLHPANMSIGVVAPNGVKLADDAELRKIVNEEWEAASKRTKALAVRKQQVVEGTTIVDFDNGTRLLVTPDKRLPIVAISGGFRTGLRDEPQTLAGISNFMAALLPRGTENHTRQEISDMLESIAGGFGASVAADFLSFNMNYLANEQSAAIALPLFAELIQRPAFPAEEVEIVRKQLLPQFQLREDNLFQVGLLSYLPRIFGENGYGRVALGDKPVVEKLQSDDFRQYYRDFYQPSQMVVAIVGDVDVDQTIAEYAKLFGAHRDTREAKRPAIKVPAINKPVQTVVKKGKAQSHIFYGWQTVGEDHEDRYALEVMNAITTGMGGRLFLQLRDKQSLAYSVASIMPMRDEAGSYLVYVASAPEKVDEAVQAVRDQITLLREKGVSQREVDEAKRFLIGNLAVDRQSNGARANGQVSGELDGKGFRFEFEVYPGKIEAITVDEVNRVARKYLKDDQFVYVLVQ